MPARTRPLPDARCTRCTFRAGDTAQCASRDHHAILRAEVSALIVGGPVKLYGALEELVPENITKELHASTTSEDKPPSTARRAGEVPSSVLRASPRLVCCRFHCTEQELLFLPSQTVQRAPTARGTVQVCLKVTLPVGAIPRSALRTLNRVNPAGTCLYVIAIHIPVTRGYRQSTVVQLPDRSRCA